MPATQQEAFLEDIIAHPRDAAPRLIYADWLDEHGQAERAEFIRVQHALAAMAHGDPGARPLLKRQADLLSEYESEWRAGLPVIDGVEWGDFGGGFVESVAVRTANYFLQHADAIFSAAPVLRLRIIELQWGYESRHLAANPRLKRLSELNLGDNPRLGPDLARDIAVSPHLGRLSALLLHRCDVGNRGADALAGSRSLGGLAELYLSGNRITDAGAVALAHSEAFPNLADLDLRDNSIRDDGVTSLTQDGDRRALETLWLTNNEVGPAGAEALTHSERLPHLERLYLNHNPIGDDGAAALASSPHRTALREADLRHCGIGDRGARALASSPYLEQLGALWLGGNRIRPETVALLRERFGERVRF